MTQTQPDRLDQLESVIERIDRNLDTIVSALTEIKINVARIDERLNGMDKRLDTLEGRTTAQDTRLWGFITALIVVLTGLLAKQVFFPSA